MILDKYFEEKRKRKLAEDFQYIINKSYPNYISETHTVVRSACLHIVSKDDPNFDIEEIFKTIRSRVFIDSGAIDYSTKGDIDDIRFKFNFTDDITIKDERILVFEKDFEYKYYRKHLSIEEITTGDMGVFNIPKKAPIFKDKKQEQYSLKNLFIYVVEKGKIYDGYSFMSKYLPQYRKRSLYYIGSINYIDRKHYDTRGEVMLRLQKLKKKNLNNNDSQKNN